ncbi:MAG: TfoX/Sxy family protein, partial [Bulleidia sp.]
MASHQEYLEYILESSQDLKARKMMGEYLLYFKGIMIGGIYDNRLLVKPCPQAGDYLKETIFEMPYEGGSPMYLVRETDNRVYLRGLFEILAAAHEKKEKPVMKHDMDTEEKICLLNGKDDRKAYALLKEMIRESKKSSEYVQYVDTFLEMIRDQRSSVRVRGFRMACAQGVHLETERMKEILCVLSGVLDEEKPTALRQYLASLY